MLKRYLLNTSAMFAPPDEGKEGGEGETKTPAQIEREKIQVTTSKATEQEEGEGEEGEEGDNKEGEEAEGDEASDEGEEQGEEGEEKEIVEAKEDDPEKLKRTIARLQRRLDKSTGSQKDLKRELADAKAKLEASPEQVLTEADVETRAEEKANQRTIERQFRADCDKLNKEAVAIDKDFNKKVDAMAEDIGAIPSVMIGVLSEIDNGGAVLNYLTDNVEEAEDIYTLSPAKMAVKLTKIGDKLEKDKKKAATKDISKVPDPVVPIKGGNKGGVANPATVLAGSNGNVRGKQMENYVQIRNRQDREKREARLRG